MSVCVCVCVSQWANLLASLFEQYQDHCFVGVHGLQWLFYARPVRDPMSNDVKCVRLQHDLTDRHRIVIPRANKGD